MIRDLVAARKAYQQNDVELAIQAHNGGANENQALNGPQAKHDEKHSQGGDYIKSMVYGGIDGIITTYSVVMSVLGINLSNGVVLTLGLATLFADAIAMGLGDYLSSKSENDFFIKERMREEWEVENNPDGERLEMVDIYKVKGIDHDDAIIITETLSKNKKVWIDIMMIEELGLIASNGDPIKDAFVTFLSFIIFGIVPILPFVVGAIAGQSNGLFIASTVLTGFIFFVLGYTKSLFSETKWYWSGLETLILGAFAALVAYLIGLAFQGITRQ